MRLYIQERISLWDNNMLIFCKNVKKCNWTCVTHHVNCIKVQTVSLVLGQNIKSTSILIYEIKNKLGFKKMEYKVVWHGDIYLIFLYHEWPMYWSSLELFSTSTKKSFMMKFINVQLLLCLLLVAFWSLSKKIYFSLVSFWVIFHTHMIYICTYLKAFLLRRISN